MTRIARWITDLNSVNSTCVELGFRGSQVHDMHGPAKVSPRYVSLWLGYAARV